MNRSRTTGTPADAELAVPAWAMAHPTRVCYCVNPARLRELKRLIAAL